MVIFTIDETNPAMFAIIFTLSKNEHLHNTLITFVFAQNDCMAFNECTFDRTFMNMS